jgi:hypothetical protein
MPVARQWLRHASRPAPWSPAGATIQGALGAGRLTQSPSRRESGCGVIGSLGRAKRERCRVSVDQSQVRRIDELERRVKSLEDRLITRDVLDDEIRSLESRLRDLRELTDG